MNYLKISNNGLLESGALTLLGASTKRGDKSKIGKFGTGFKFALAYFLRNDIKPIIYNGKSEILIQVKPMMFNNTKFEVIHIDNTPTSITTEFGADWNLWQALREVYSNAVDEGGSKIELVKNLEHVTGTTAVYLPLNENIKLFYSQMDKYFAYNRKPIYDNGKYTIYDKIDDKSIIYRKGIRVATVTGLYDYDFEEFPINESRTPLNSWTTGEKVNELLIKIDDVKIIRNIMDNLQYEQYIESSSYQNIISIFGTPSTAWEEALNGHIVVTPNEIEFLTTKQKSQAVVVSNQFKQKLNTHLDITTSQSLHIGDKNFIEKEPTAETVKLVNFAIETLNGEGFNIGEDITYVSFSDKKVLGAADVVKDIVYISNDLGTYGISEVLAVLIEENIHIKTKAEDYTREFQNAAIRETVSYILRTVDI